jgi:hypothetical protein
MKPGKYRELFGYEEIAKVFEYNPETGELFRHWPDGKLRRLKVVKKELPDRRTDEATQVGFRGYLIISTHIMFMLMERRWPKPNHVIDHRDGDVVNNRWSNLREATPIQTEWKSHPA